MRRLLGLPKATIASDRLIDLVLINKAVYFGFHAIAENPNQRFADFVAEMKKRLDETKAENLIIDMRLNGGGNTGLVMPLIQSSRQK